jgi:WD40 repeat protein
LATGDDRGRVFVLNAANGEVIATIDCGHRNPIRRVALSDDGRLMAAPAAAGLGIWAVENSATTMAVVADESAIFRFIPGGDRIATAGRTGVVRVWLVASGREESALFGHVGRVTCLGASPDGRTVVSGGANGEVKFWDIRTGQEVFGMRRHSVPVTTIEFATNGKLLVTGGDGQVAEWRIKD